MPRKNKRRNEFWHQFFGFSVTVFISEDKYYAPIRRFVEISVTSKQKNLLVLLGVLIVLISTINRFVESSLVSLVVIVLIVFFMIGLVLILASIAKLKKQQNNLPAASNV